MVYQPLLPPGLLTLQQDSPKSCSLMTHGSPVADFPLYQIIQDQIRKEHPKSPLKLLLTFVTEDPPTTQAQI